jgi:hypothetical protein
MTRLPARFTLAHGLMVLAGLATFVFVNSALSDRAATVEVAYADVGSQAGAIATTPQAISASTPGVDRFARPEDLVGKVLVRSIEGGTPIMKSDLIDVGRLEFRTLTIPIDGYQIEGLGLVRNDRVDVVGFDDDDAPVFLAHDLIVDATSSGSTRGFGGTNQSFVTVQVGETEALLLSLGQRNGPLHIVRSTGALPMRSFASGPDQNAQSQMDRP